MQCVRDFLSTEKQNVQLLSQQVNKGPLKSYLPPTQTILGNFKDLGRKSKKSKYEVCPKNSENVLSNLVILQSNSYGPRTELDLTCVV